MHFCEGLRAVTVVETGSRMAGTWAGGGGGESVLVGTESQFYKIKGVLTDGGGRITV